jgi:hypothetical protein
LSAPPYSAPDCPETENVVGESTFTPVVPQPAIVKHMILMINIFVFFTVVRPLR